MSQITPEVLQRLKHLANHLSSVVYIMENGKGTYKEKPGTPKEYDWIVGGFGIADLVGRKEKQLTEAKEEIKPFSA